jgi:transcriptional regulator with GAF, ATPase, and Fis domain
VKGSLARLIPAIQREMKDAGVRHERRQRERELEAIAMVSATMRSANALDEILPRLLDQTLELIGTDSGSIWLHDPATDSVNLVIQRSREEKTFTVDNPGEDIPGLVVKTGQAMVSREFHSDQRIPENIREHLSRDIGGVCVPLNSNENVIGALCINVTAAEITTDEMRILNAWRRSVETRFKECDCTNKQSGNWKGWMHYGRLILPSAAHGI